MRRKNSFLSRWNARLVSKLAMSLAAATLVTGLGVPATYTWSNLLQYADYKIVHNVTVLDKPAGSNPCAGVFTAEGFAPTGGFDFEGMSNQIIE